MNNWIVLPLLIPLCAAVVLVLLKENIAMQRLISAIAAVPNIAAACLLVCQVRTGGIQTLRMGGWIPPYGIVFVADMFAALLVFTTAVVGAACLVYSFRSIGRRREKHYFYPFFHFLLAGVTGSFLTGDLFNLFVCFEVMLIASYALIVLGGTRRQLRETLKYILINIVSSTLFVTAIAYLYSVAGTLNIAHLSVRIAEAGQGGIVNVIAVLFLIVFSLKAGLFLFFWLPGSYGAPPAAVTALFGALLTKVGLYALIRVFTLIFYHDPNMTHRWIGWMAAATMILGGLGAVAYTDIRRILNYNVIVSVGFIAFGLAVAAKDSLQGVVFYLLHDMVAKALVFFLGGMIAARAGTDDVKEMGGLIGRYPLLGWMFFVTALAMVGVPPLSGFPGKALMIRGGLGEGFYWFSAVALLSSLIVLYSMMNIFMHAFWGREKSGPAKRRRSGQWMQHAALGLFVVMLLFGIGADWAYSFVAQAGEGLAHPEHYIESVLKGEGQNGIATVAEPLHRFHMDVSAQ
ncbi:Na(+)/H(+) antiporter subunit D [Paenibacillus sp. CECT 9249]|uniref:Na+/H+ antiporter subunit D n=1 Tax=Paenibacillus sp. CECT 9249 TaxID=2845385 RepID=UPI001E2B2992|nr:Na+/H+ antiporter subunit D [Paenibacillus sp. CECT 9249]CAH0120948.1 Na(+)/H(+) antiporter subunit D [Paenibacillus sp. CECT 9249]